MTLDIATHICSVEHGVQFASAAFALIAAFLWLRASRAKVAPPITPGRITVGSEGVVIPDLQALMEAVKKQSKLNARAALFAFLAALCQVPLAFAPACWSGSPWFG